MTYKGWENYVPAAAKAPRSKYGNKAVTVDGLTFDSKREAARYQVLKVRLAANDIRGLKCQPRYELRAHDQKPKTPSVAEYVADFEYQERDDVGWRWVIEDVKGHRTDVYRLKKKWFEAQYNVTILET